MQLSDRTTGLFLVGLGGITTYGAWFLPPIPGQQIGPGIFPLVVGLGLVFCGLLIAFGIGRQFEDEAEADLVRHQDAPTPETAAPSHAGLRALVPITAIAFYAFAVNTLGFILVGAIMVGASALALRAPWKLALGMAICAPPVVHFIFYKMLRVPLPDGFIPMPW
jgi:putative tricarboxylic transport membrane protein